MGAILSPEKLWKLAQRWYGDRLSFDWDRTSEAERQQIFEDLELTGTFWDLARPTS